MTTGLECSPPAEAGFRWQPFTEGRVSTSTGWPHMTALGSLAAVPQSLA